jgi:hypothetical protein
MTKLDDVFTSFHSTKRSEARDGEAWFWIALTAACVPWFVALVVWLI